MTILSGSAKFFAELFTIRAETDEVLARIVWDKTDAKPTGIDSFVVVAGAIDIAVAAGQCERNSVRNSIRIVEHLIRQIQSVSARSLSDSPIPFRAQRPWLLVWITIHSFPDRRRFRRETATVHPLQQAIGEIADAFPVELMKRIQQILPCDLRIHDVYSCV